MTKNIIILILGFLVWAAYSDEANSASQENQYCDIKTTLVKTVDKDGKVINQESKEIFIFSKTNNFPCYAVITIAIYFANCTNW